MFANRVGLAAGLFFLVCSQVVFAQTLSFCHPMEHQDLSDRVLLVKCSEQDVSHLSLSSSQASQLRNLASAGNFLPVTEVSPIPGAQQWLMVTLESRPGFDYRSPGNNFQLILYLTSSDQPGFTGETSVDLASVAAAGASLCSPKDYKVLSESIVALRCAENDVSGISLVSGAVFSIETGDFGKKHIDVVSVSPVPDTLQWLVIKFAPSADSPDKKVIERQHKYRIALQVQSNSSPPKVGKAEIDIDTAGTLSIISPLSDNKTYIFESHVGFKSGPEGNCELTMQDFSAKPVKVSADCAVLRPVAKPLTMRILEDLNSVGRLRIALNNVRSNASLFPRTVPGLVDVYGLPPKFDAKSQLAAPQAPATKDSSNYYLKFDHAAGTHATPAWVLEGRIAPAIGTLHAGFQFYPIATADIGQSKLTGITYTDTVTFGASFTRVFRPNSVLQGLLFTPAATFETDKEFDRDNLIANPDLKYYFAKLYAPRRLRTLQEFTKKQAIAKANGVTLSPDNVPPAKFGYSLDFHSGVEIGGALRDTTVTASVGKVTQTLPAYSIARIVPQVHGQLEFWRFTLDAIGTPRYLALTENTVLERPDHSLLLKRVNGWTAYGVISGNFALDAAGHFSLNTSYKAGFAPPRFIRVNTVQTGILVKY